MTDGLAKGKELLKRMQQDAEPKGPETPEDVQVVMALAVEQHKIKEELDALKKKKSTLQERYDELRLNLIPDAMRKVGLVGADGKGSFTTDFGKRCQLRTRTFCNVKADQRKTLHDWLRKENMGDLIQEAVNIRTLGTTVKELLGDGKNVPDFITVHHEISAVLVKG